MAPMSRAVTVKQRKALPLIYVLVFTITSFLLLIGFNIYYTNHVARNICGVINILDGAYSSAPPATPIGRQLASEIHKAKLGYGC